MPFTPFDEMKDWIWANVVFYDLNRGEREDGQGIYLFIFLLSFGISLHLTLICPSAESTNTDPVVLLLAFYSRIMGVLENAALAMFHVWKRAKGQEMLQLMGNIKS